MWWAVRDEGGLVADQSSDCLGAVFYRISQSVVCRSRER
ncbi:hypothetical protein AVEN_12383-1, partial [Araneus ventricosus]